MVHRRVPLLLILCLSLALTACTQTSVGSGSAEETLLENGESAPPAESPETDTTEEETAVVPGSQAVDPAWFADAAFVGDSVSVMLEQYNDSRGVLGSPTFFCSVSLSQTNALTYSAGDSHLPEYPKGSGQHPRVEDGIAAAGAKKVYLMLGVNCLSSGVDRACSDLLNLVDAILTKSPEAAILLESVTPMTAGSPRADELLNNTVIQSYNQRLKELCQEKGWYYINVAEALQNESGFLRDDFSGDEAMGIHLNYNGAAAWASYLLTHVPEALK